MHVHVTTAGTAVTATTPKPDAGRNAMPRCRSCETLIDWARTTNGNLMPVNTSSAGDEGNLAVWRDNGILRCRVLPGGTSPGDGERRGLSHYATCPQAMNWRQP